MDIKKRQIKGKIVKFVTHNVLQILGHFVPKKENLWIFGAWHGDLFMGNSKYLYLYIKDNRSNIIPIWMTKSKDVYKQIIDIGGIVYFQNTLQALYYGLIGKVYIYNTGIDDVIHYSLHNAKIVNLWHGMPLKKMTLDRRKITNYSLLRRLERKVVSKLTSSKIDSSKIDLIIATSESTKRDMYSSFKCPNIKITGQPREDIFYSKIDRKALLRRMGIDKYEKYTIVSYLPTFRDRIKKYHSIFSDTPGMIKEFLQKHPNILIIEKSHYHERLSADKVVFRHPNYKNLSNISCDTQELLCITDILITDYSSVFIDFLHLNRPIIFYPFDFEDYYSERGFFYKYDEVACGRIVYNPKDLFIAVASYVNQPELYSDKRELVKKLFYDFSDGQNSKRVYEKIVKIL